MGGELNYSSDRMEFMDKFKANIKSEVRTKDLNVMTFFIGMDFKQSEGKIEMNQQIIHY